METAENILSILEKKLQEPKNASIREQLRKMLDNLDLKDIRQVMHMSGYKSVDYSFIQEEPVRAQLEIDNIRMEDAARSTRLSEDERFYTFCVNAFFQIENLLNYYFAKKFPVLDDMLSAIEAKSKYKRRFLDNGSGEKKLRDLSVGDIEISFKSYAFADTFFPGKGKDGDFTYKTLNGLRDVRNEGLHRCQILDKETSDEFRQFVNERDYSKIRATITKICNIIDYDLKQPDLVESDWILANKYPSAIFFTDTRTGESKKIIDNLDDFAFAGPGATYHVTYSKWTGKIKDLMRTDI